MSTDHPQEDGSDDADRPAQVQQPGNFDKTESPEQAPKAGPGASQTLLQHSRPPHLPPRRPSQIPFPGTPSGPPPRPSSPIPSHSTYTELPFDGSTTPKSNSDGGLDSSSTANPPSPTDKGHRLTETEDFRVYNEDGQLAQYRTPWYPWEVSNREGRRNLDMAILNAARILQPSTVSGLAAGLIAMEEREVAEAKAARERQRNEKAIRRVLWQYGNRLVERLDHDKEIAKKFRCEGQEILAGLRALFEKKTFTLQAVDEVYKMTERADVWAKEWDAIEETEETEEPGLDGSLEQEKPGCVPGSLVPWKPPVIRPSRTSVRRPVRFPWDGRKRRSYL